MSSAPRSESSVSSVAFVSSGDARGEAAVARLAKELGEQPRLFRARDLNDVQREIERGAIRRVVFARVEDAVEGCWDEQVRLDDWSVAGVTIEIADPPMQDSAALLRIVGHWGDWNARRRRRQAIGGAVLSVVAIAAAFFVAR